jgi:hypothetical protein
MWQEQFNADIFDLRCQMTDTNITGNPKQNDIIIEFMGVEYGDWMQDKGYVGSAVLSLGGSYAVATRDYKVAELVRSKKQLAGNALYINGTRWKILNATAIDRRTVGQQFGGNNRYVTVFALA